MLYRFITAACAINLTTIFFFVSLYYTHSTSNVYGVDSHLTLPIGIVSIGTFTCTTTE